ncbi:MAG: sulfite exporter TauE/SafE family protein, partial [Dehalococcoidales bacterium]|nr:sulfite exporter TauE/SafE family protein [Dehalococcoidales bacterium]
VGGSIFLESFRTKSRMDKTKKQKPSESTVKHDKSIVGLVSRIRIPPVLNFSKSGTSISLWIIVIIGFGSGVLAGFIGVGGGFVLVPSMVYLFGVPSFIAVGTSLFQIIFPSAFGAARYTMEGSVVVFASFIMIAGSSIGIYFGAQLTRYLHEISMKYVLALTILVAVCGSILKMVKELTGTESALVQNAMCIVTFGGLAVIFLLLSGLFVAAIRKSKNKPIPSWTRSFIKD